MPDIETLARQRAEEGGGNYMEWLDALSEGAFLRGEAHLGERDFHRVLGACASPKQFSLMVEVLDAHAREHPEEENGFQLMAGYVDDSPDSLADWVLAIEYFYDWLAQNSRPCPGLRSLLDYLSCCVASQSGLPHKEPLVAVLEDMLDQFGYQG